MIHEKLKYFENASMPSYEKIYKIFKENSVVVGKNRITIYYF
ncbi:MAG: hypothetical protein QXP91_09655 [Candidatus Methanomethylicia archaeon]